MSISGLKIRAAVIADTDAVAACAKSAYSMYVHRIGREPAPTNAEFRDQIAKGIVCVAILASELAGFIISYPVDEERIHVESLAVWPGVSGRGMGKALLQHTEATARARDFSSIELYTNEAMTENFVIYPRLGYVETGQGRQDGFSRVFVRKEL